MILQKKHRCFWKRSAVFVLFFLAAAVLLSGETFVQAAPSHETQEKTRMTVTKDRTIVLARETAEKEAKDPVSETAGDAKEKQGDAAKEAAQEPMLVNPAQKEKRQRSPKKLRFTWKPVADAVRYELIVEEGA